MLNQEEKFVANCRRKVQDILFDARGIHFADRNWGLSFARQIARRFARWYSRKPARRAARRAVQKARREASFVFHKPVEDDDELSDISEVSAITKDSSASELEDSPIDYSDISDKSPLSRGSDKETFDEDFNVVAPLTALCRRAIRDHYTVDEISQFSPFFHQLLEFVPR